MDPEAIVNAVHARQIAQGPALAGMREVIQRYDGDFAIGLPTGEQTPATIANLVASGIDNLALQASISSPTLVFPPLDPTRKRGPGSAQYARNRRLACASWLELNNFNLIKGRIFRFLIGTGSAAMVVWPDFKTGIPRMQWRSPLNTFPSEYGDFPDAQPEDCGFSYVQAISTVRKNYPAAYAELAYMCGPRHKFTGTETVEIIEWVDDEQLTRVVSMVAPKQGYLPGASPKSNYVVTLESVENKSGMCPAIVSNRITIGKLVGQFNSIFGMHDSAQQLMHLDLEAQVKAVYPDIVLIGPPGQPPVLTNGDWVDGRYGVNMLQGGSVQTIQTSPPQGVGVMLDRLERNERIEGGVNAQLGGESPTNIQTGRAGQNLFNTSVSPRIAEYQTIFAGMIQAANKRMMATAKGYSELQKKSFFVTFPKNGGHVDYDAVRDFETYDHKVVYSYPGVDPGQLAVALLQRVGAGLLSAESAMEADPFVQDPESEMGRIRFEATERLAFDGLGALVQGGTISMVDLAGIGNEMKKGSSWMEAIDKVQQAAQKRQATQVAPGDPAAQAGIQAPGMSGVESPTVDPSESVSGIAPAQRNVRDLLLTLGGGATRPQL